jgi:hypothetical protein
VLTIEENNVGVVPDIDSKDQRIMSGIKVLNEMLFISSFFYLQFSEK